MKQTFVVVLLLTAFFGSLGLSQSTNSGTSKKAPAKKTNAAKSTAKKSKTSSKTVKRAPAPVAYRQTTPTPERYKEIQQALADKGYLKSEPNGVWDAESSAAMARFQNDRKLDPSGKLNAASLIALGLGPGTAPIPPAAGANASGAATPPPPTSN